MIGRRCLPELGVPRCKIRKSISCTQRNAPIGCVKRRRRQRTVAVPASPNVSTTVDAKRHSLCVPILSAKESVSVRESGLQVFFFPSHNCRRCSVALWDRLFRCPSKARGFVSKIALGPTRVSCRAAAQWQRTNTEASQICAAAVSQTPRPTLATLTAATRSSPRRSD